MRALATALLRTADDLIAESDGDEDNANHNDGVTVDADDADDAAEGPTAKPTGTKRRSGKPQRPGAAIQQPFAQLVIHIKPHIPDSNSGQAGGSDQQQQQQQQESELGIVANDDGGVADLVAQQQQQGLSRHIHQLHERLTRVAQLLPSHKPEPLFAMYKQLLQEQAEAGSKGGGGGKGVDSGLESNTQVNATVNANAGADAGAGAGADVNADASSELPPECGAVAWASTVGDGDLTHEDDFENDNSTLAADRSVNISIGVAPARDYF